MNQKELATQMRKLSAQLAALAIQVEELDTEEPVFPEWAQKKQDARICFGCGEHIDMSEAADRGYHGRCIKPVRQGIKDGILSERKLIEEGMLAPAKRTGRPPTESNQKIKEKALEAASQPARKATRPKKS